LVFLSHEAHNKNQNRNSKAKSKSEDGARKGRRYKGAFVSFVFVASNSSMRLICCQERRRVGMAAIAFCFGEDGVAPTGRSWLDSDDAAPAPTDASDGSGAAAGSGGTPAMPRIEQRAIFGAQPRDFCFERTGVAGRRDALPESAE
jgi:hypothetical protein